MLRWLDMKEKQFLGSHSMEFSFIFLQVAPQEVLYESGGDEKLTFESNIIALLSVAPLSSTAAFVCTLILLRRLYMYHFSFLILFFGVSCLHEWLSTSVIKLSRRDEQISISVCATCFYFDPFEWYISCLCEWLLAGISKESLRALRRLSAPGTTLFSGHVIWLLMHPSLLQ